MKLLVYLTIVFLSIISISSPAQDIMLDRTKLPKVYAYTDFSAAQSMWGIYEHRSVKITQKNGKYHFLNKEKETAYNLFNDFGLDPNRTCYIEMEFSVVSGPEDYGSGLIFNHTTTKKGDEYNFQISPNQYYRIYETKNGVYRDVQAWTSTSLVNTTGNNKLGLLSKGGKMFFYINDKQVYEMKRPPYLGANIGFVSARNTEIAIDKFMICYTPSSAPINLVEDAAHGYKKIPLDSNINSTGEDGFPTVSADGKLIFFTRSKNIGSLGIDRRQLVYSEFNDATKSWSMAKPLPPTINQGGRPQVVYVSPDKNMLIINATYQNGKYIKDGELSISYRTADGWGPPNKMEIEGWHNRAEYEDYAIASGAQVLLMSIQGNDAIGERDIYVSFRKGNKWSTPKNIGAVVNTYADDYSLCLAPDNVTLYYATSGKRGYGKDDIFMTRRLDDTWLNWSEPQNLGPDINSVHADYGLIVDAFGQYAYIDDNKPNVENDIYKIQIPESARPRPVIIVKGKVYDKTTNEPLSASILYENLETRREAGTALSNKEDGSFILVLPYGVNYGLVATLKGYLSESRNINIKDSIKNGHIEMSVDLYVTPIVAGSSLTLNSIFFEPDKFDLTETSFSELDRLYTIMLENPQLTIQIEGHTDFGTINSSEEELTTLSRNRSKAVKDYLVNKGGIDGNRILTEGYGRSRPLIEGNNPVNRRVEVKVIKL